MSEQLLLLLQRKLLSSVFGLRMPSFLFVSGFLDSLHYFDADEKSEGNKLDSSLSSVPQVVSHFFSNEWEHTH